MDIKSIVRELCSYDDEQEWFEFKENCFSRKRWVNMFLQCQMPQHFTIKSMLFLYGA